MYIRLKIALIFITNTIVCNVFHAVIKITVCNLLNEDFFFNFDITYYVNITFILSFLNQV